jgi:hypothetical protein
MEGKAGLAVGMEVCITSTLGIRHRFSIHQFNHFIFPSSRCLKRQRFLIDLESAKSRLINPA